jgi:hypothetical protein
MDVDFEWVAVGGRGSLPSCGFWVTQTAHEKERECNNRAAIFAREACMFTVDIYSTAIYLQHNISSK